MAKNGLLELSVATGAVHHITIEYQGENYDFPWKELPDFEVPKPKKKVEGMTEEEEIEVLSAGLEQIAYLMIARGAKAEQGFDYPAETFYSLPKRMRSELALKIFNLHKQAEQDFLPGQMKTATSSPSTPPS
jgi:hypothetical protein